MNRVTVNCPARIHLSLIGMNDHGYRINGGVGFAIDHPRVKVTISTSNELSITDRRQDPLDNGERKRLVDTLSAALSNRGLSEVGSIEISGAPRHSGFGSGTAIRIACIEGIFRLNGASIGRDELIALSRRGGTSGIGINTYFRGGLILDIGHSDKQRKHTPSSIAEKYSGRPVLLKQIPMPDWPIGICLSNSLKRVTSDEEKEFFISNCPISDADVYEVLYHATYGVYGAICEKDKKIFAEAILKIQGCKWKALERNIYGDALLEIEDKLYSAGAKAVGMSSLGSGLYFVADDMESVLGCVRYELSDCNFWVAKPDNTGRVLSNA